MSLATLQLIALVVSTTPQALSLVEKLVDDVKQNYKTDDERIAALQSIINMLAPMELLP